ncbi:MAG TPA: alpha/beta fold hydrolase [Jatrophihabitans sp.]|nr:alpha/beta fold hydrolase [Jatrophihabitans sp.]
MTSAEHATRLLQLRRTQLLDLDAEGRILVGHDETGSSQLYEISPDGRWRQLTDLGEPCTGRYLPGQRTVVLSADTGGTEREQLSLLDLAGDGVLQPVPVVHDPAFIHTLLDVGPDRIVYATNRRDGIEFDIIERTVSTGAERVLFDGGGYFSSAAASPDGRWVLLSRMTLLPASTELLLVDTRTGEVRSITDPAVPGTWANPQWLADSSGVLASADTTTDLFSLYRFDLASGGWSPFRAADGANLFGWPSPDGDRLALVTTTDGYDQLTIVTGEQELALATPQPGVLTSRSDLRWSPDGSQLGVTFSCPSQPPEAYTWSSVTTGTSELVRRSSSNPDGATAGLSGWQSHQVPAPDGELIPVYVARPAEPTGSVVFIIHGGPEAAQVPTWSPIAAALTQGGHTVVLPNVRGSSGYGRRWVSLDDVAKRLDSVADLVAIRDWLPSLGVDQHRIALYGGSYGGYMVLAGLAFHPGLWAAGVDIVGVSSLVTFLQNTSGYRRAYREREYGRLVEDREVLDAASPFNRIDRIQVPLFVIHGANDPRVPLSEAEQVVAAVRATGAECPFLVYQDEGHGLAKRVNQLDAYPQALAFLDRVLSSN